MALVTVLIDQGYGRRLERLPTELDCIPVTHHLTI